MSVWQKQKNWWNEVLWKPKKPLSLDQLKFQHHMLLKNPVVTDNNRQLLVETFRSIAEILIWGDQNDSRVFDFFLEKNMQSFFLKTLSQKCGRYVSIQLLQTLNILFENIKNETSLYYLLSNNHINSIIVLKLDFSDEEILAYYISFLKTLSFHLNKHTIHFFYNEHLRDFPLYTEAIKFFKHSESMVRIAVRTLTLNVYRVDDKATLQYICNKTAVPYFSNLVWFIGNHIIELDECLISQALHLSRGRLEQLVAEHLDHLHYISDIFSLEIQCLNDIMSDHFLNRLLIPLYVYSLTDQDMGDSEERSPRISSTLSLFLLSQVFLILSHSSIITPLAYLIFTGDTSLTLPSLLQQGHQRSSSYNNVCAFIQPESSLETSLVRQSSHAHANPISMATRNGGALGTAGGHNGSNMENSTASNLSIDGYVDTVVDQYVVIEASPSGSSGSTQSSVQEASQSLSPRSSAMSSRSSGASPGSPAGSRDGPHGAPPPSRRKSPHSLALPQKCQHGIPVVHTLFLDSLMGALSINNDDTRCLFALSMFYAMLKNKGIHHRLLEAFSMRPKPQPHSSRDQGSPRYNSELVALLLSILDSCTSVSNCIRLVTLRLAIMVLQEILDGEGRGGGGGEGTMSVMIEHRPMLQDHHFALVESIYESAILRLRLFHKGPNDEVFLDLFEEEYDNEKSFKLNVPYLMMDESMLLPPTDAPHTGIDFTRRLPCGEYERERKVMRVFFAMRLLSQQMSGMEENELPLTPPTNTFKVGDTLDTSPHDLVLCKVSVGDTVTEHFMVVTDSEFLLVNPHKTRLGCGVVHFIAFLQDLDISGDPADGMALFIIAYARKSSHKRPSLSGRFVFEDHIRCSAAKSFLQRSRDHLHLSKMTRIAKMLHLPPPDSLLSVPGSQSYLQQNLSDATPPSVISVTPTLTTPTSSLFLSHPTLLPPISANSSSITTSTTSSLSPSHQFSSSVVHKVFTPSSTLEGTDDNLQTIEMSSLKMPDRPSSYRLSSSDLPPALTLGVALPSLDEGPVRLTLPAPPDALYTASGSDMGIGTRGRSDMLHDLSPTPEPSHYPGSDVGEEEEEGLTASGGLLQFRENSSERSTETKLEKLDGIEEVTGEVKEEEIVCPLGVELRSEENDLKQINRLNGESSDEISPEGKNKGEFSTTEHAQMSQSASEQSQSHSSTECALICADVDNSSSTTVSLMELPVLLETARSEQAQNSQISTSIEQVQKSSTEHTQNSGFIESAFSSTSEHGQNSTSTDQVQNSTSTDVQNSGSIESVPSSTSTEHIQNFTSTDQFQYSSSTEHVENCSVSENALSSASTECAHSLTSTEQIQSSTCADHVQNSNENARSYSTSTDHTQNFNSNESAQNFTSTEHAATSISTEDSCIHSSTEYSISTKHYSPTEHAQISIPTEDSHIHISTEHAPETSSQQDFDFIISERNSSKQVRDNYDKRLEQSTCSDGSSHLSSNSANINGSYVMRNGDLEDAEDLEFKELYAGGVGL